MLFSILIAHYNNATFLSRALDSVLQQKYTNWEVVLVDDASTDHFEAIINGYASDPRIRVLKNPANLGCGFTKRRCVKLAAGEVMGFLDPDDALHPEALSVMMEAHKANPQCSLIYSSHYVCDASLQIKRKAEYIRSLPEGVPYLLLGDGSIHLFASFLKRAYDKTEGIDSANRKAVDKDLYYKLEETGAVLFIDKPLYYYRIHQGSISNLGQEAAATLIHYSVARKACLRRINALKEHKPPGSHLLIKQYRTRYYKLAIFENFKTGRWFRFIGSVVTFPFVGGMSNLISYALKLPSQGTSLLRKSFLENYEIKV
jgi:glycosyltransferase involved in cell wall biosynthesis